MESTRRQSKKRDAIREILLVSYDHPSVEEIYRRLKPDIPDLSLGTVNRNLPLYPEEGKAMSVATGAGQERFDAGRTPTRISSARSVAAWTMWTRCCPKRLSPAKCPARCAPGR